MTTSRRSVGAPTPRNGVMRIQPYVGGEHATDGFNLASNENPLGAGPAARAAFRACSKSLATYPDGGAVALREAIANAHGLDADRIVCGSGSDELISLLCQAYTDPDTEVVHSAHGFLMYRISALAAGAEPVSVPEPELVADVDGILRSVRNTTRIVFLANPNNPTGSWLPATELARLAKRLSPRVLLVIDAAYAEYQTDPDYQDGHRLVEECDNVVMLRTFSKIHGLAGLRVGWAYGSSSIVEVLHRVRGPFNTSVVAQAAAAAAIGDDEHVQKSVEENSHQRTRLTEGLTGLGLAVMPSAGNFVLARFESDDAAAAADAALRSQRIFVRGMAAYGLADCVRITVGTGKAVDAVTETLSTHLRKQAA